MKKITVFALCAGSCLLPLSAAVAQGRGPLGDGPPDGPPRFGGGGPRNGGPRGMGEKGGLMRVWRGIDHLDEQGQPLSKAQSKRLVALILPWSKKPTMTQNDAKSLRQKLEAILTSAQKTALDFGPRGFGPPPEGPPGDGPPEGPPRDGPDNNDPNRRGPNGRGPRGGDPGDSDRRGGPRPMGPDGPPDDGPGPRGDGFGPRGGRGGGRGPGGTPLSPAQRQIVRAWHESANPFYAPTGSAGWKKLPAAFQQDEARRYRESRATLEALSRRSR